MVFVTVVVNDVLLVVKFGAFITVSFVDVCLLHLL